MLDTLHSERAHWLEDECEVVIARSSDQILECLRLRYQVYCLEKGFEPGNNGIETDEYDERARHILLIHRKSREPVGTVRVIPPSKIVPIDEFPMARACPPGTLKHLPALATGEISRFAVSKWRRMSCGAGTMIRLGLMQGVLELSVELELTHWCAIMEPTLLRLLRRDAIHFAPLGSPVEYHGMRQPSFADIGRVLHRTQYEQLENWNYVTMDGRLWPDHLHLPAAAALVVA